MLAIWSNWLITGLGLWAESLKPVTASAKYFLAAFGLVVFGLTFWINYRLLKSNRYQAQASLFFRYSAVKRHASTALAVLIGLGIYVGPFVIPHIIIRLIHAHPAPQ
jgi:sensor histidine kinase YesM